MGGRSNEASLDVPLDPALYVYSPESEKEFRGLNKELHVDLTRHFSHPDTYMYFPPSRGGGGMENLLLFLRKVH